MLASKRLTRLIAAFMAAAVVLCVLAVGFSEKILAAADNTGITMEYQAALFDTDEVLGVNIIMEQSQWEEMLENAISEEYYQCDVEIGGQTFYRVGIRPKGNTSLSSIANNPDTDRYSFKLKFDQYVEGQTCFGLDELILNSNYADATNMKEALIYDMFAYLGADASLYSVAKISVNGEYWGVYLALEGVGDSFLLRSYGAQSGSLYKPESEQMGGGSGTGGANLNYTDDSLDSYTAIWDNAVTQTTDADHQRVVTALKNISQGTDLEDYMDIDNLLRYLAVHIFSVNEDSLSGSMAHNYYLYESGGKLNLLPWDYNLAFGGMSGGSDADSVVNSPIDDAFSITTFFDTLMENEEYQNPYWTYLSRLVEEYVEGGGFDAFYTRIRGQLDSLVESDPTAFYSYEEYEAAAETLYQTVKLRGQSIAGQLDGSIPSTKSEQVGSTALVDASGLNISAMGSMNAGGQAPQGGGNSIGGRQPSGEFEEVDTNMSEVVSAGAFGEGGESAESGGERQTPNSNFGGGFNRRGGGGFAGEETQSSDSTATVTNLIWYAVSLTVLLTAMTVAVLYRRKIG